MITPYQKEEDWTICAINFKGTIYLCAYDHEEKDYPNKDKFVYWGYKFEQYMFASKLMILLLSVDCMNML